MSLLAYRRRCAGDVDIKLQETARRAVDDASRRISQLCRPAGRTQSEAITQPGEASVGNWLEP